MTDYCTCGAQLPPDALFCHKCGKPQREIIVPEPVAERAPQFVPPPTATASELPVNFHNPVAVRIALLVAITATVLGFLPVINWIAAGFFAVFFYRRRTGSRPNVGTGVKMGWITGVLMFALTAVVFTAQQIPAAFSGRLMPIFQAQLKSLPMQDPTVARFFESSA